MRKVEQLLLALLMAAAPFQTRLVFFSREWYFNEWQSMALYGTDVLIITLLVLWAVRSIKTEFGSVLSWISMLARSLAGLSQADGPRTEMRREHAATSYPERGVPTYLLHKQGNYALAVLFLLAAYSIVHSSGKAVSVYQLIKLAEFAVLFLYLKAEGLRLLGISRAAWALIAGGLMQSVIAVGQYVRQADLGLRFLGETLLSPRMQGIASFYLESGEKVMRAYGTTPHPNVLAGYLFLSLAALYWLFWRTGKRTLVAVIYPVVLFGFLLTFSRTIIAVWAVAFIVWIGLLYFKRGVTRLGTPNRQEDGRSAAGILLATTAVFSALFLFMFWPQVKSRVLLSVSDEAVSQRVYYSRQALRSGDGMNWSGVGLGDFTNWLRKRQPSMPRELYQPVHNIYLLIYTETGILGLAAFVLFLFLLLRRCRNVPVLVLIFSVLAMGLFDHFLWTLQQGRFVLWLVLALAGAYTTMGLHESR